jgi:hypothetical protein
MNDADMESKYTDKFRGEEDIKNKLKEIKIGPK